MSLREIELSTHPSAEERAGLELGDIVYLTGLMYTAREGVYHRVLDEGVPPPVALPDVSATNFHCAPAASIRDDGTVDLGAVTATASFRFRRYIDTWIAMTGARLIVGKGGMGSEDYRRAFVPNGVIYLSTVGYGTGALLGRGVEKVEAVHWHEELGLAQAMWILRCRRIGPFIVASDRHGNCLFERENAKIAENLPRVYEGMRPAVMRRYGETNDPREELFGPEVRTPRDGRG